MKRAGAILLTLAVVAICCSFGVIGLLFTGFRCWESCEDPPEVWSDDPDSWQWDALGALGLATIASAIVLLVLVILKRRTASWIALGTTALLAVAFTAIDNTTELGILGVVAIVALGAGAIVLTPAGQPRGFTSR
jgi:hypothetical protein